MSELLTELEKMLQSETIDRPSCQRLVTQLRALMNYSADQSQRKIEELSETVKAKSSELEKFLYQVSHDLKQPIITIHGFTGIVKDMIEPKDDVMEWLNGVLEATERLDEMIGVLLELSRIRSTTRPPFPIEEVSLVLLVEEAKARMIPLIQKSPVELIIDVSPDLSVVCERERMVQVLFHLLSNAYRYYDPAKEQSYIRISAEETHLGTKFVITDNGIGIDPKYHSKIFDLFFSLEKTYVKKSTGSGLTLVSAILDEVGGSVGLTSEPGVGTSVEATVPRVWSR